MKINPSQIAKAMEIYKTQKPASIGRGKKEESKKDELVLSDNAQAFQIALRAAKDQGPIDLSKIEEIKDRIQSGQYNIDSRQIAEKMVDDLLNRKRF